MLITMKEQATLIAEAAARIPISNQEWSRINEKNALVTATAKAEIIH